jgi:hypothetical protein
VSGSVILLAWIIAMIFFFMRRKKRRLDFAEAERKAREPAEAYILPPDPAILNGERQPGEYQYPTPPRLTSNNSQSFATNVATNSHQSKRAEAGFVQETREANSRISGSGRGYVANSNGSSRDDRSYYPPSSNSDSDQQRRSNAYPPGPPLVHSDSTSRPSHTSRPSQASTTQPNISSSSSTNLQSPGDPNAPSHVRMQYSPQELAASRMQVADRPQ